MLISILILIRIAYYSRRSVYHGAGPCGCDFLLCLVKYFYYGLNTIFIPLNIIWHFFLYLYIFAELELFM